MDLMIFNQLQEFRQRLYNTLGNGRDAIFDLMDAVLVGRLPRSLPLLDHWIPDHQGY